MSISKKVKSIKYAIKNFLFSFRKFSGNKSNLKSIYDRTFSDDEGNAISLSEFKGKKLLIVNTASACGYTFQYSDLEKLSSQNKDKLNVVAFPCNDFGRQEQGSNDEIQSFCKKNFGVTFKVFKKTKVKRSDKNQIFHWLTNSDLNGWNDQAPMWNFWKFLIDEEGRLVAVFPSRYSPVGKELVNLVNSGK
ncbi:MAG: glutathione peroxidase [Bacteroidota bacterium]